MVAGEFSTVRDSLIQYDQQMIGTPFSYPERYEYNQQKQLYMHILASVPYLQTRSDPSFHDLLIKSVQNYFTPENAWITIHSLPGATILLDDTLNVSSGLTHHGVITGMHSIEIRDLEYSLAQSLC